MIDEEELDLEFEDIEEDIFSGESVSLDSLPIPNGYCYNCCEPLKEGKLFCDSDCREDYKKRYFRAYGKHPIL